MLRASVRSVSLQQLLPTMCNYNVMMCLQIAGKVKVLDYETKGNGKGDFALTK